jgi:solute carrier family 25 iron transporter 28/37
MMIATSAATVQREGTDGDDDEDWEEWDGKSPFWAHCVAGSLAGVVEHTAVYPLDTVRTHIQVACSACAQMRRSRAAASAAAGGAASSSGAASGAGLNSSLLHAALKYPLHPVGGSTVSTAAPTASATSHNLPVGMFQTIRYLMNEPAVVASNAAASTVSAASSPSKPNNSYVFAGWMRLWRGVETVILGCVPAHALYFSSYEVVKSAFTSKETGQISPLGSSLAGAAAVVSHDLIMTPLDTVKQRMQLGHYGSVRLAIADMARSEGVRVFYRSFSVTLASNMPYGMIMVSVNEHLKQTARHWLGDDSLPALGSSHNWKTVVVSSSVAGLVASAATTPLDRVKTSLQTQHLLPTCYKIERSQCRLRTHANWREAALYIFETEGFRGFWRGMIPRVLSHTPAVAISWTTYETAKQFLMKNYP